MLLFDRMAADLSFAVEAMAREERRGAVEAELRTSEERFVRLTSEPAARARSKRAKRATG